MIVSNAGANLGNSNLIMPVGGSAPGGPHASIKVYNCANQEVSSSFLYGNVVSVTANSLFYALYTTKSQLSLYSARSMQVIKDRLQLDNVCMLASTDGKEEESGPQPHSQMALMMQAPQVQGRICTISLKGVVSLFKVKDEQSLQSCMLEWQASLAEPLKARNPQNQSAGEPITPVYVEDLRVTPDGTVIVFFTDRSRFEYHQETRLWR